MESSKYVESIIRKLEENGISPSDIYSIDDSTVLRIDQDNQTLYLELFEDDNSEDGHELIANVYRGNVHFFSYGGKINETIDSVLQKCK